MTGVVSAHHAAIFGLLQGGSPTFTVYDGQVPNEPEYPYAVLYMDTGIDEATKLCGDPDTATFRFQVTSVGLTAMAALVVVDESRIRVLGVRPVIAGRAPVRIRKETTIPIREDRDVTDTATNRHPMFGVDTYVFESWKD
ncbi:hypothetical protein VSH64_24870 [Amycolatopsis rhabdoformis]|uniref:DUF3168 domain-containing protein n=1 Tax=Amycolatopsis rhabdoformis TaxID=1448059 RepID=A0ABZ1HX63_9PSEU|nr:hypothetical protein [Amycolatopsis rhabdoformis]WSE26111.1 hypothetical protein VSH64_24870 [Amycolatopsis rhabdoformis]